MDLKRLSPLDPSADPDDAAPATMLRDRPGLFKGRRFLIAEDNQLNRRILEKLLHAAGAETRSVTDGLAVLEAINREQFDLLLIDVHMPKMDGIEACRRIRQEEKDTDRHLPIIAVTASVMDSDRTRILEAGMDGFLCKPVNFEELARKLMGILTT